MKNRLATAICSAFIGGGVSLPAKAETFVGGALGYAEYPELASSPDAVAGNVGPLVSVRPDQNKQSLGFRVFGGAWVTNHFGFELGYADLGKVSETITASGAGGSATWSAHAATQVAYAALDMALGARTVGETVVIARTGVCWAQTRADASLSGPGGYSGKPFVTSRAGALVGLGFERRITSSLSGRVEFEVFLKIPSQFDQANATALSTSGISLATLSLSQSF